MDPKLRQQLFIRKHKGELLTVLALAIVLLPMLFLLQTPTQFQQQAATKKTTYDLLMKCFDKPSQSPALSGQANSCTPDEHKAADLNNDGIVDGADYNLLMRQNANQK